MNFVVVEMAASAVNSIYLFYVIEVGRKYVQYMSVIDDRYAWQERRFRSCVT
jgi:hypothetical protein